MENFIFCAVTLCEKGEDYLEHCQISKMKQLINLEKSSILGFWQVSDCASVTYLKSIRFLKNLASE